MNDSDYLCFRTGGNAKASSGIYLIQQTKVWMSSNLSDGLRSSVMSAPLHFDGHALVSWSETDITIAIPWYMGLMFRTRKSTGVLLQASAGDFSKISLMVSIVFQ